MTQARQSARDEAAKAQEAPKTVTFPYCQAVTTPSPVLHELKKGAAANAAAPLFSLSGEYLSRPYNVLCDLTCFVAGCCADARDVQAGQFYIVFHGVRVHFDD